GVIRLSNLNRNTGVAAVAVLGVLLAYTTRGFSTNNESEGSRFSTLAAAAISTAPTSTPTLIQTCDRESVRRIENPTGSDLPTQVVVVKAAQACNLNATGPQDQYQILSTKELVFQTDLKA